ncbi:MAG: hypothetical protein ACIAXF_08225 [Phycisphaerales bacterium JB063]
MLPVYLLRALFGTDQATVPGEAMPDASRSSYPQPRWEEPVLGVTPVRYDPQASDRAKQLLDKPTPNKDAAAQTAPMPPDPFPVATTADAKQMTFESILPPQDVDESAASSDRPEVWHEAPAGSYEADSTSVATSPIDGGPKRSSPAVVSGVLGMRRGLVRSLSMVFTVVRWTPRILWCCSFGLIKAGYDILSEAAQTSKAPAPRQKQGAYKQLDTLKQDAGEPTQAAPPTQMRTYTSGAVVVSAPYRPVVFEDRPRDVPPPRPEPAVSPRVTESTTLGADSRPKASAPISPTAAQPAVRRDPAQPPPVPPLYPVKKDFIDEIASANRSSRIIVGPSSVLPSHTADSPDDQAATKGGGGGFFASGLGNLLLILLGATMCFAAGFALSLLDKNSAMMAGVLLMIAGVGGILLGMMLLNEWVAALRFQLVWPVRLAVRGLGLCAAVCLLAAFAAATIPREHWPL